MGSTYVVGKRAQVIVDADGTKYFMLAEETFESNCYPRTPRWSAVFFGNYAACMRKIIRLAGGTEGGMTKGTATTSSAYIKQRREQLACPNTLVPRELTARIGSGIYEIPATSAEQIEAVGRKYGMPCVVGGVVRIDLNQPCAPRLLAELTSGGIPEVHPWRFLDAKLWRGEPAPDLGVPIPKPVRADVSAVEILKLPAALERQISDEFLVLVNGQAKATGWDYSTMQYLLEHVVTDAELASPGAAEPMIRALRPLLKEAPLAAGDALATFTKVPDDYPGARWRQEVHDLISNVAGACSETQATVTLQGLAEASLISHLNGYPSDYLTLSNVKRARQSDMPREQLELLAA